MSPQAAHFRQVIGYLTGWIDRMDDDPGVALAHLTWLGLSIAQNAQSLAEDVVGDEPADSRFLSLDGALFDSYGNAVTFEREYFTILNGGSHDD